MANSKRRDNVVVNFFVGLAAASLVLTQSEAGTISDSLMEKLQTQGKSDAVLELPSVMSKVMSNPMMGFLQGDAKVSMMTSLMQQFTSASQAPFMSAIQSFGIANQVEPFFITNKLSMQNVDLPVLQALAKVPGPFTIREPTQVKLIRAVNSELLNVSTRAEPAEWGVKKIEAPSVWSSTTRGENVVVAGIDTGVRGTHEALVKNYGGAFYDGMNDRTVEPYDDDGHGTHTMGTIAGQNGIGVAPGAKWIACKGLGPNGGSDVTLSRCAQWLIKQRPLPKVVCNSWGGGQNDGFFNDEIDAWHGAGIIPVFAIGNEGSGCQTAGSPGDQDNVISVGATDSSDKITSFSSRGYAKGTRRMKPEVSAPGARIRSAFNKADNSYATLDGTSMATPHVTGAVALMLSANPSLNFEDTRTNLQKTAFRPTSTRSDLKCGKSSNGNYPNNAFGYGRINVKNAIAV